MVKIYNQAVFKVLLPSETFLVHGLTFKDIRTIWRLQNFTDKQSSFSWPWSTHTTNNQQPRVWTAVFSPDGHSVTCESVTWQVRCFYLITFGFKEAQSHLRSINTPHLYFIYSTRGKLRRAFLLANGSHTMRRSGHQSCRQRAVKRSH